MVAVSRSKHKKIQSRKGKESIIGGVPVGRHGTCSFQVETCRMGRDTGVFRQLKVINKHKIKNLFLFNTLHISFISHLRRTLTWVFMANYHIASHIQNSFQNTHSNKLGSSDMSVPNVQHREDLRFLVSVLVVHTYARISAQVHGCLSGWGVQSQSKWNIHQTVPNVFCGLRSVGGVFVFVRGCTCTW